MSLRFIYGRSGSGKSKYCLDSINDRLLNGEDDNKKLVYLVPEQFTFQSDKNMVNTIGEKGIHKIQVLSFTRMAYVVFNETGGVTRLHMNSAGKNMLLYKIIEEIKDDLGVFSRAGKQAGFINIMSEVITELKRYDINPEILALVSKRIEGNEALRGKMQDINLIFGMFEAHLHKKYIDTEDELSMLAEKLDKCPIFDDGEIWIDEFSVFTPLQYKIIERLLKKAKRVNITLTTDCLTNGGEADNTDVFMPIKKTEGKLLKLAEENNIQYEKPVYLDEEVPYRLKNSKEIIHLEKYFFHFPYNPYKESTKDIKLFRALNMYSEIQSTARDIIRLCRDKGLRFNDIAVITRDLQGYENLVKAIFLEYNIPYFIDKRRDINGNPLIILLNSVIEVFTKNWSYESVFRYLKTGLSNLEREEIDVIENYVLANGIRGGKWTEEKWQYGMDYDYDYEDNEEVEERLEIINDIKKRITDPLFMLQDRVKGKRTVRELCTAIYDFLTIIQAGEKVEKWVEEFKTDNDLDMANEYSQVWNIIIELLDQLVEVLGDEEVRLDEFVKILATGINEYDIGVIPPALDQVLVGSIERVKSQEVSAVYIIGVNDGVFPRTSDEEGILSDRDREDLKSLGLEIAADTKSQAFEEQFLIYRSLTIGGRYLRISYPIADFEGRSMRPSIIASRLKKIFPRIIEESDIIKDDSDQENLELIVGESSSFNELIAVLRREADGVSVNPIWWDAYRWYMSKENWIERCKRAFSGVSYNNQVKIVNTNNLKRLYGNPLQFSVSRLERYAQCPFAYYVQYGLKAEERKVYEFSMPELGSFIHEVLDQFSEVLDKEKMGWREVEDNFIKDAISVIVDDKIKEKTGFILNSSSRYKYMGGRLKRILTRSVDIIAKQIKMSSFNPSGYEMEFGRNGDYPPITIQLPSGEKINLIGRIDRVDELDTEDGIYIRIIDYKSGNKGFKLSDVYYGLQLQLLVYLDAILSNKEKYIEKGVFPGAVFYFRVEDPMISSDGELPPDKLEDRILKELKMRGLLLKDINIIKEMDKELDNGYSLIIPAQIVKGSEIGDNTSGATLEQFELLRQYTRKIVMDLCEEMLRGNISIKPYKKKKNTPCEHCNFAAICQFDTSIRDNKYNYINDKKDEEVWELMKKEVEEAK